jgi:hypothetical protein
VTGEAPGAGSMTRTRRAGSPATRTANSAAHRRARGGERAPQRSQSSVVPKGSEGRLPLGEHSLWRPTPHLPHPCRTRFARLLPPLERTSVPPRQSINRLVESSRRDSGSGRASVVKRRALQAGFDPMLFAGQFPALGARHRGRQGSRKRTLPIKQTGYPSVSVVRRSIHDEELSTTTLPF